MKIETMSGGLLGENGYIVYENDGGGCYIIDPGSKGKEFLKFLNKHRLKVRGILLTHHHSDHTGAVRMIKSEVGCPVFIHTLDGDMCRIDVDEFMEDGDRFSIGDIEFVVINTPGHTKGSICLYCQKYKCAFTGDTIFDTDLGRTDLEDGSDRDMSTSVLEIIDKWSNEITIYPGHGASRNMKYVRKKNEEFLAITGGHERR